VVDCLHFILIKSDSLSVYLLSKVALMEDEGQNIHLKNLSIHPAGNEEDALNLLFLGDTNRMIAEVNTMFLLISTWKHKYLYRLHSYKIENFSSQNYNFSDLFHLFGDFSTIFILTLL